MTGLVALLVVLTAPTLIGQAPKSGLRHCTYGRQAQCYYFTMGCGSIVQRSGRQCSVVQGQVGETQDVLYIKVSGEAVNQAVSLVQATLGKKEVCWLQQLYSPGHADRLYSSHFVKQQTNYCTVLEQRERRFP